MVPAEIGETEMTLTEIKSAKAEGFEMAQEILAKEGKEFALAEFHKYTPVGASLSGYAVAFYNGFLNAVVGMSAKESHGY